MRHEASALLISALLILMVSAAVPAQAGVNWWTPVGPEGGWISDLAVDPQTRTVYAATSGGVFASTNGGGSWERRNRGVHGYVSLLEVSSVPAPGLYVVGGEAVYRSRDGGLSWTSADVGAFGSGIQSMAVDPTDSSVIYAGLPYSGVLKSSDGGASWTLVLQGDSCGPVDSLVIDPRAASTIYAGCGSSGAVPFFKSTDGGATWKAAAPLPDGGSFLSHLVLDSARPGVVYIQASVYLDGQYSFITYKSSDDGASWTRFGLVNASLLPGPPGVLFMGKYRSIDDGATWQELSLPIAPSTLAFAPDDPATLYAGTAPIPIADPTPSGIYKSTDAGATWTLVSRGLFATSIRALEVSPQQSTLYALAQPVGLLKGPRGGSRWERADAGLPLGGEVLLDTFPLFAHPLAIDPWNPANLYFGSRNGLARSTDGGASWAVVSECATINNLFLDPQNPDRLYASGYSRGTCAGLNAGCSVFRSDDAGASWTCIELPQFYLTVDGLVLDPSQPSRLYVLRPRKNNIWMTSDRGSTWRKLRLPRPSIDLTTLTVDPKDSRRLYLGTSTGRVYKSTNRGSTWTEISKGLPAPTPGLESYTIRQIVVDPERPQTVYVVHASGIYISGNGGSSWHPLNGGLPDAPWVLVLDPQNPRKLYAGTMGNGVYAHERR
jgi:photosystem II stability/assembly factor-like uncharacterized protein